MGQLMTLTAQNQEDALKYAYAFMQIKELNLKECSFMNPTPTTHDKRYLFPRDMYSAAYTEKVPEWDGFKTNPVHLSSPGYSCVASIDKKDKKRVVLAALGNMITFSCYGDYEEEAKNVFNNIVSIHSSIK